MMIFAYAEDCECADRVDLRSQYWRLDEARKQVEILSMVPEEKPRPMTCFIYKDLTTDVLKDFLLSRNSTDTSLVYALQTLEKQIT
ncbi:hypothetical protein ScPMuIL_018592 [Solemya velum]